ncbi:putative phage integrase [Ralstonia solanacearum PSI07]|nr:putative phage integrase [Ralstonia solanacearum PSI07]
MSSPTIRSAAERSATTNFETFVVAMRADNPLGIAGWEDMCWELGQRKRVSSGRSDRIWFNKNFVKKVTERNAEPFPPAFGDLLRAIVCAREVGRATSLDSADHMVLVRAFRYLYGCAKNRADHPTNLARIDFDEAAAACRVEAASSAYRVGCKLQEIARILDREYLTPVRLNWVNPIPRDSQSGGALQNRTSREFFERRDSKLPSEDLLNALANIANREDLSPPDLLRQRAVELLVCGGFRCNELLMLPRDIWVEEPQIDPSGMQVLDRHGSPVSRYGLRYLPEKNGHHETQIKWIPSPLVDIARRAVRDVMAITEPFAEIARFMHKNPGRALLEEPWHSLPDGARLSMHDVVSIVGLKESRSARAAGMSFVKTASIAMVTACNATGQAETTITKADLEAELFRRSASSVVFPRKQGSLMLHQCLFLVGVNFVGSWRSLLKGTVTLLTQGQFDDYLTDRVGGARSVNGTLSIFSRLGYVDAKGDPLRATSHQFRHWLNTLAQEGGLSQVEISRWMGRRTIDDNAAYDHQTGFQLAKRVRDRIDKGEATGSAVTTLRRIKDPVRRSEFGQSLVASAHVTDIGVCVQDLSALPCERHRECTTCNDHFIQKGDEQQRRRAQEIFDEAQLMLRLAKAEQDDGSYGADNWLAYQELVSQRASHILDIHNDDSVADGTLVQVPGYAEPGR